MRHPRKGSILFLHDLAVLSNSFGKGIGSKMMAHLGTLPLSQADVTPLQTIFALT